MKRWLLFTFTWAIAAAMGLCPVAGGRFGIPFGRLVCADVPLTQVIGDA